MVADCAMADRAARGFVMQYFEIIAMWTWSLIFLKTSYKQMQVRRLDSSMAGSEVWAVHCCAGNVLWKSELPGAKMESRGHQLIRSD